MPPLHIILTTLLLLLPPIFSIVILAFDIKKQPHCRTVLALGSGILLNVIVLVGLGTIGLLIEGQSPLSSLMPILIAVGVVRMMQVENAC